jgi:UDP-GlcNAc:undecaprenyl-phosphate GlcNAc-1-phosphate transferase
MVFVVYLSDHYAPEALSHWSPIEVAFFAVVAVAVGLAVRCARDATFHTTPMDYLMVFVLLVLGILPHNLFGEAAVTEVVMKGIILLYASELFLHEVKRRWNTLSVATVASLGLMAVRGLVT